MRPTHASRLCTLVALVVVCPTLAVGYEYSPRYDQSCEYQACVPERDTGRSSGSYVLSSAVHDKCGLGRSCGVFFPERQRTRTIERTNGRRTGSRPIVPTHASASDRMRETHAPGIAAGETSVRRESHRSIHEIDGRTNSHVRTREVVRTKTGHRRHFRLLRRGVYAVRGLFTERRNRTVRRSRTVRVE